MNEKLYRFKLIMNERGLTLFDVLELHLLDFADLEKFLDLLYILEDKTQYENTFISGCIEKIQDFLYKKEEE